MAELFPAAPETLKDPHVTFSPGIFRGRWTVEQLREALPLEQKTCVMYGKTLDVPRLECWFGSRPYRFGGRLEQPKPWPEIALEIKRAVEVRTAEKFDSCFVNFYRSGEDCIAWHADDDSWIGPVIASLSFGATRRFSMKEKKRRDQNPLHAEFSLGDGDLLVMHAGVQSKWLHRVPREAGVELPRINFTFRQTIGEAR